LTANIISPSRVSRRNVVSEQFEVHALYPAPADLTTVSDADLAALEATFTSEFDAVYNLKDYTDEHVQYGLGLRNDLDRVKSELAAREVRQRTADAQAKLKADRQMAELKDAIHGPADGTPAAVAAAAVDQGKQNAELAKMVATAVTEGFVTLLGGEAGKEIVKGARGGAVVASLGATARLAPKPPAGVQQKLAITAAGSGQDLPNLEALGAEFTRLANAIPVSRQGAEAPQHPVARIRNEFAHTVDDRMRPAEIEEVWRDLVNRESAEALVAGGGWCAPSEVMYDFFNIADMDGAVDLPTVGVTRGGIRFPVSPSIGDVFFQSAGSNPASGFGGFAFTLSNATDPWLWTETDDILTVTGSVNKPTLRVPCASYSEQRLEAYGITVTAGNLTDSAWPEATQNFIRLLRMAYAHVINARLLSLMDTASGGANTIGAITTDPAAPRIFNSVALAATDYRARYAMNTDSVLEVVMPYWVKEVIRADLAYKVGIDSTELLAVIDSQINAFFTARKVRVQWVNDYQVRGASQFGNATVQLSWPTTVNFLVYAAGTFLHGTGLQLDLGVVRDSVLNAENDFTAAWAEEAHLIAMVGHASRKYTCAFQVNGASGGGTAVRV
jgi:hypothetical protein